MEPTGTNGRTRHTLSDPLVGRVSSCGGFLVGWQGTLFLVVTTTILVRRLSFASVVRFPDRHDRNRSCGWFRCRPIRVVGRLEWFCGGHGPGETPGPFPNPEAKAWHGDGTALERVWESSAPPHSTLDLLVESPAGFPEGPFRISLGGSRRAQGPGNLFFMLCFAGQPAGARCPGVPVGPFPLLGVRIIPRTGRPRAPRDFRDFRGASCAYPMVE